MTARPPDRHPRIIIGARCYADALPAIRVGTDMAARLGAEILAILAEDEAMHRIAALPFAKALTLTGRMAEAMTPEAMQSAFARDARVIRDALARTAGPSAVRWTFEHRQGPVMGLLRGVAATGDLLLVGHERAPRQAGEIVLLDEAGPVEPRLLDLGLHLAQTARRTLRLFVPAAAAAGLRERVRQWMDAHPGANPPIAIDDATDRAAFLAYLARERPVALLVAAEPRPDPEIEAIVELARCPVVVAVDRTPDQVPDGPPDQAPGALDGG